MSCQVKVIAALNDVPTIRRHLFPTDDSRGSDGWLQQCQVAVCPTGELIALANGRKLVVLSAKWYSSSGLNQFQITYAGTPEENDVIKAVLCLPIVGQSQSSHVGPDWTCIVLGFESGYIKFYTENCDLLLYEQLHHESVSSLKSQSQHSPRPDINTELRVEELYINYPSCTCVIAGSALFTSLRNSRSQLAVVLARGGEFMPFEASTLPRKWGFQDQVTINDVAVVGLDLTNTYDHLLTASTLSGFEARYRAMPPHNSLVLGAGSKPFLAFHYALECGAQPVLSDVAKAVTSKLKSALPGWLTGSKAQTEKQNSAVIIPPEPMGCRFGLCDIRRTAFSVVLSPDHQFAAVSDSLGRVLVVDTNRGVTVRMFKGYREAQCAFIQVPDEKKSKHKGNTRIALYLVIYSGKKGTLEVFTLQKGRKVVTFTAAKHSKLVYVDYGVMGFVMTSRSRYVCPYTCILMDNDGKIKELMVPFHFTLSEKSSSRVRDLHLYKRLKQLVKSGEVHLLMDEVVNTCKELQTTEMKLQCIDMLMLSQDINTETLLSCVEYFLDTVDPNDSDVDSKSLLAVCKNLQRLLRFYSFIIAVDLDEKNGNNSELVESMSFTMAAEQTNKLQKLLDLSTVLANQRSGEMKVSFADEKDFGVSKFISLFELNLECSISLKDDVDETILYQASCTLFKKYISSGLLIEDGLKIEVSCSGIIIEDLFKLLLLYWVNRPVNLNTNLENEMRHLSSVVYALAQTLNPKEVTVEYNCTSQFWSKIREMLEASSHPFSAFTAAIVCQNVAQRIEQEKEMQVSDESVDLWEKLTQENCQWNLLIGKLEDVSLLNIILGCKPVTTESRLPKLKHIFEDVSLKFILMKGRGSVSELVAKWLTSGGVDPELLVINDALYQGETDEELVINNKEIEQWQKEQIKNQQTFEHLNLLKNEFPYSLKASMLLCNMSWEYAVTWLKNVEDLANLEASVSCLKHIPEYNIKLGVSVLLWNTHLKMIFESCCKLMNKVGKLPKPKLCQQDTKFSDVQLVQFLEVCCQFLDYFMDTFQKCSNTQCTQLQYEPIFENGGRPLAELALQQNTVNYDLLHLHYQLSLALVLMGSFEVKHSKPLGSLFNTSVNSVFFSDITKECNLSFRNCDQKIIHSQTQFLYKIISASIESITINNGAIYATLHVNSMAKCVTLARMWNIEVDLLKRYQIIQLFTSGFDSLAEELLPSVTEKKELGPALLAIAGKRLAQFLASSTGLAEMIGALSPTLTSYLEVLNGEWCSPSSLDAIVKLGTLSLHCNPEDVPEHKLNNLLLDACFALKDFEQS